MNNFLSEAEGNEIGCLASKREAHVRVQPLHARAELRILKPMRVHIFHRSVLNVLREVIVDLVCHFVVDFSSDRAIWCANNMSVLRFGVEHDAADGVMLALDRDYELFALMRIGRNYVKEVSKLLSLVICVGLDDPVVGVVEQWTVDHFEEEAVGERVEHGRILVYKHHLDVHLAGLVINFNVGQCVLGVLICQIVNDFEALADSE